jgi:hypothetical protein
MRVRIGWGVFGLATVAIAGCGGSSDSAVPPQTVSRNIAGVWRRSQIGIEGTRVSCPDPKNLLAPNTRELTINNIVVDTCGSSETLILGTATTPGKGRYRMVTLRGTEDGNYAFSGDTLTLVRDAVDGTYLKNQVPPQASQRTVYSVVLVDNTITISPVAQPVGLKKVNAALPAFREDGSIIASNVTPVINSDGTVNTVVLPGVNDVATVNADLSITIGSIAAGTGTDDTPGLVRVRGVENSFQFVPADPTITSPTPMPSAPSGS